MPKNINFDLCFILSQIKWKDESEIWDLFSVKKSFIHFFSHIQNLREKQSLWYKETKTSKILLMYEQHKFQGCTILQLFFLLSADIKLFFCFIILVLWLNKDAWVTTSTSFQWRQTKNMVIFFSYTYNHLYQKNTVQFFNI